jgi:periplasmic divalent cation tolerance protein
MLRDDDVVLVISNAPDIVLAERIGHILVESGLAACVNLGAPVLSIYRWNGDLETAQEIPLWIKTTAGRQQALVDALVEIHPYEVPEILVVPVVGGIASYLQWVREHTAVSRIS